MYTRALDTTEQNKTKTDQNSQLENAARVSSLGLEVATYVLKVDRPTHLPTYPPTYLPTYLPTYHSPTLAVDL